MLIVMKISQVVKQIYRCQKQRLIKKGIKNIGIASFLLFLMIYGSCKIGQFVWPVQIQDKNIFVMKCSFAIHFICFLVYFLIYLPGYLNIVDFYRQYRINPDLPKPWERDNWGAVRLRTIKFLIINHCIIYPIMILLSMHISDLSFKFTQFPSFWQVGIQFIGIYYIEDLFFYALHRITHQVRYLYGFHKVHHEYDSLYTLMAQYTHPIDQIIGNLGPSAITFMIFGGYCHCFMIFFWQIWKMLGGTQSHCGYDIPWSPLRLLFFIEGASYHDFHHSKNKGNFAGSVFIWDSIFGTNQSYYDSLREQKNK